MPDPATIRIGTRGSELATTQAGHVRDALIELGQPAELVIVKTAGDHNRHDPVEKIGIGVFTQALRHALREGVCDIIVHSFKDLPTLPEDDMMVAAVPERVDPREALISRDATPLMDLPEGARVGTSAPRRVSQLRALRSDLELVPLRGNIETRMGRVSEDLNAVILARAGLERTGRLGEIAESLDVDVLMPAPAQGALALECRTADREIVDILRKIDHPVSHARAVAERAVLNELEAGCTAPVAAYSTVSDSGELTLQAGVFALDGSRQLLETATANVDKADELGRKVAAALLERGAHEVMGDTLRESQK
ncbi:hydroxymethylbilane synthase [Corynebacterium amycolatum]|uniref:hydroxymethylbilane synthase n=1 Tax=Corynebacterium amycolatum TaxID=43765 RepID=UPI002159FB27|nr:hydroxymethylbilane synthase [Corynebacterium amycolatum]UVE01229.1 hydroxymethylbilane synthase [Corynebacterium amycolatum]